MRRRLAAIASCGLLAIPSGAAAQLTPAQAIDRRALSELTFSPDGAKLALTVAEAPKGSGRNRDIWVLDMASRALRQYTNAPKSDSHPRWSPDGRSLAFLSDREGQAQIFVMPVDGGEARRLTDGKRAVQAFEWSPDGKEIAFLAPEPETASDEKKTEEKDDARVVGGDKKLTRLWVLDVASQSVRQLTSDQWSMSELVWTPTGSRLVVKATNHPDADQWTERIYGIDVAGGALTEIAAPKGPVDDLRIAPDGKVVAYLAARIDGPSPHDLYLQPLDGGAARNLTGTAIDRPIGAVRFRADGSLLALGQTGFSTSLFLVSQDGKADRLQTPAVTVTDVALARSGTLAFVGQTTVEAPEVFVGTTSDRAERASHFNDRPAALALVRPEFLRYKSFDGVDIEASLLVPAGRQQTDKVPLVVMVHGGPTGRWTDTYDSWGQVLVSHGFAVLYPNIRGSTGYGHRFLEMNRADWGGADFKDVMAGVDFVIGRGLADPDRLGIAGWSYGGYMAMWAITQTGRFTAAVAGAGMSDLAMEYGTEEGPAYDEWFYGLPYEQPEGFGRSSPIRYVKDAKTPVLLLHGESDPVDPLSQSQIFYRALKRYGVKSELVVYPREPHGFREERHIVDVLGRMSGWFETYLKASGPAR